VIERGGGSETEEREEAETPLALFRSLPDWIGEYTAGEEKTEKKETERKREKLFFTLSFSFVL
jgi:hypothetical protein